MSTPGDWVERKACVGPDMVALFDAACDGRSGPGESDAQAAAIRVCFSCPVREDCLAWALELDGKYPAGIFGGLLPSQRLTILRGPAGRRGSPGECGHRWPNKQHRCPECAQLAKLKRDSDILARAAAGENVNQIHVATGVAHRTIGDVLARYANSR